MKAVLVPSPGPPSVLTLGMAPTPQAESGEVLIKVAATAVNRADTLQRKGAYPPPPGASPLLGLESAGTVEDVGEGGKGGKSKWKKGDRVMALMGGGGYAEYCVVPEHHLLPVPEGLDLTQAAALPEVWLTAFQLLHLVGKVKAGDRVLVHAGASGVGTAAVQLIKLAGAKSIVTAGSEEKVNFALELGADKGVNYKNEQFQEVVGEWTEGKGVDLILDCVGGSYAMQNVASLALDGKWVLYGWMGGSSVDGPILGGLLRKRGSLLATTLRARDDDYKADLVEKFRETCLAHFSGPSPALKPVIDSIFKVEDVEAAHTKMEANKNMGKIILKF